MKFELHKQLTKILANSAVTKLQERDIKLKSKLQLKKLLANRGLVVLTLDLQTTQELDLKMRLICQLISLELDVVQGFNLPLWKLVLSLRRYTATYIQTFTTHGDGEASHHIYGSCHQIYSNVIRSMVKSSYP